MATKILMATTSRYPETNIQLANALDTAASFIKQRLGKSGISIVLGSGLGNFANRLDNRTSIPYDEIPFMPRTTVEGHSGALYYGYVNEVPVYCWGGRLHRYEGYENFQIAFIAHLTAHLGCHTMIITNAAGGAIPGMIPGCILICKDHINCVGINPMDYYYPPFYSQKHSSPSYDLETSELFKQAAEENGNLPIYEGTYYWFPGSCFETPYEVQSYVKLGASLFGQSTVPEVVAARLHGLNMVVGSVITNLASGIHAGALDHEAILAQARGVQTEVEDIVIRFIAKIKDRPRKKLRLGDIPIEKVPHFRLHKTRTTVTEDDIARGVTFLKNINMGHPMPTLAIVTNRITTTLLKKRRVIRYREIPGMPILSLAGKKGKVIFATYNNTRIVNLFNNDYEGLEPFEAYFLVQCLISLGVGHVHYLFPGESLNGTCQGVVNVKDYISHRSQGASELSIENPRKITSTGEAYVMSWAGPTLPTAAEKEMSRRVGNNFYTIANMAVLNEASNRGLPHSAALVCWALEGDESTLNSHTDLDAHLEKVLGYERVNPSLMFCDHVIPAAGFIEIPAPRNWVEVDAIAHKIFGSKDLRLTLICSFDLAQFIKPKFNIVESYCFDSKVPQRLHVTDNQVLIIEGSPYYKHNEAFEALMVPMRISNKLGIRKILIADEVIGCSEDTGLSSWVVIKDHALFAGVIPLHGLNNPEWGVRFPDVTKVYPKADRQIALDVFAEANLPLREVYSIHVSSERQVYREATGNVALAIGAEVICLTGVHATIVSQHRKKEESTRDCLFLGHVKRHTHFDEEAAPRPAEIDAVYTCAMRILSR